MRAFSCLVVFCISLSVYSQNLIQNAGFESGNSNWYTYFDNANGYTGSFSIDNLDYYAGSASGRIDITAINPSHTQVFDRIWRVQLGNNNFSVQGDKVYEVAFKAKASSPHKRVAVQLNKSVPSYDLYDQQFVDLSDSWESYSIWLHSPLSTPQVAFAIHCGSDTGSYWFDEIELVEHHSVDVNWYAQAQQRIDTLRKGQFDLNFVDKNSNPLNGIDVEAVMQKHAFPWGTELTHSTTMNADEQWVRQTALEYFNGGVPGNDFKWPYMEPQEGQPTYSKFENEYLNWGATNDWDIRGHALVWGGTDAWKTPPWLFGLPKDTALARVQRRIERDMTRYKGMVKEYDVVNEMLFETDLRDWLSDTFNAQCYRWARQADPTAKLYTNEFGVINANQAGIYRQLLESFVQGNVPFDAIGIQGHIWSEMDWKRMQKNIDFLAELGFPIKITEFDVYVDQMGLTEAQQAEMFGEMLRFAFSHPAIEGFIFWGFWDKLHWKTDAGMFRQDKSPKPAADTVYHLIHEVWTTADSGQTNGAGGYSFNGYFGSYAVTATYQGKEYTFDVVLDQDGVDTTLVLDLNVGIELRDSTQVKLYPNPATDGVQVSIPNWAGNTRVTWYSLVGQKMAVSTVSMTSDRSVHLAVPELVSGLYNLVFEQNGQMVAAHVLIR